jgi:hypothetical protein
VVTPCVRLVVYLLNASRLIYLYHSCAVPIIDERRFGFEK